MKASSPELYQQVFADAPDAILIVEGRDNRVVDVNGAAVSLLGVPVDRLVGQKLLELCPAARRPSLQETVDRAWHGRDTGTWRGPLLSAAGGLVEVCLTARVTRGDNAAYLAVMARDNADQMRTRAELQESVREANRSALAAAQAKSRFAANLTHELRTPLNALIGMSSLLVDMDLDDEPREAVEIMADSARGLLSLVNDVLDFAKIEAGKMDLRREPFELEKTLQGIRGTFALQASGKGLDYVQELDPGIPRWLTGDEGRLRQVLLNLVSNALKFTDEGGVTVAVRFGGGGERRAKLDFSVTDTGCGIAVADQAELFDAFTQVDNPGRDHTSGTGLGLTISRQLVKKMGGRLELTSEVGRGSTFSFSVQLEVESKRAHEPETTSAAAEVTAKPVEQPFLSPGSRSAGLHVLLAEDNKVNQKVALGILAKYGFTGVAADNGRHALALLTSGEFDLVFMDLQMPEMDGLAATREIRAGAAGANNQDIPIIAMTGRATRRDRRACLSAGMNGYVTKPISSDRILEAIADLARPGGRAHEPAEPFSMAQLIDRLSGDADLALEMLEIFQEDTAERLQRIATAVGDGDFVKAGDEAFAIENGAENVGAHALLELARELQISSANKEQEYAASLAEEMAAELEQLLQTV